MYLNPFIHGEIAHERDRESPARAEGVSAMARELAQRLTGTDVVRLLWHPSSERVELTVRNRETGEGFHLDVAAGSAIDAFYHPYAYAAWRSSHG